MNTNETPSAGAKYVPLRKILIRCRKCNWEMTIAVLLGDQPITSQCRMCMSHELDYIELEET